MQGEKTETDPVLVGNQSQMVLGSIWTRMVSIVAAVQGVVASQIKPLAVSGVTEPLHRDICGAANVVAAVAARQPAAAAEVFATKGE